MKQSEVAAELVAIKEQAVKSKAEIISKLDALEQAIANQENASPEVEAALADVRIAVGEIDSLIEDAPTEETPPTEEQA